MMPNKELDEMRETIASIHCFRGSLPQWNDLFPNDREPYYKEADQIFSLKTSNGYSIRQMIEFFGKIKRDTQREAVVKKTPRIPEFLTVGGISEMELVEATRQSMLAKHFVEEVKERKY